MFNYGNEDMDDDFSHLVNPPMDHHQIVTIGMSDDQQQTAVSQTGQPTPNEPINVHTSMGAGNSESASNEGSLDDWF